MKRTLNPIGSKMIFPLISIIFSCVYLRQVADIPAQDALLVKPVAIVLIIVASISIVLEFRKMKMADSKIEASTPAPGKSKSKVLLFLAGSALYIALLTPLGFLLSTALFIGIMSWFLGVRRKKLLIGVSIATPLVLYFLFQVLLEVPLPPGLLQFLY